MAVEYIFDLDQGTDEWLEARRGLITASELKLILTAKNLKAANNEKSRAHLYEIAAQRISKFVEPTYLSDDMMRGNVDEIEALMEYDKKYGNVQTCGQITNDKWGYKLGYSPDSLVGDDGLTEIKSRRQKYQIQTIVDDEMPTEHILQVQGGLMISERKWCDYISYCGGLPMYIKRIYPDNKVQQAIQDACDIFHEELDNLIASYGEQLVVNKDNLIPTERKTYDMEIV